MPSSYVSAEWVVDDTMGTRQIKAIGDDGTEWWVPSVDTDVPPWPEFLKTDLGKEFLAKTPPS